MENVEKWEKEYIEGIDLSKIEWVKFNAEELNQFYEEYYLDKEVWNYVTNYDYSVYPTPIGLHYLTFNPLDKCSYLLGLVPNNIGKKTIVGAIILDENYFVFNPQERPLTYIAAVEVNSYFLHMGLYRIMCNVLIKYIKPDQDILCSRESDMGKTCNVKKILEDILEENGFEGKIWDADDVFRNESGMREALRKRTIK